MEAIRRSQLAREIFDALEITEAKLPDSHCPHSGLRVAAGLVLDEGEVITGVNYESDSYGLTLCAERSAMARAQSEGTISRGTALVLVASWRDPRVTAEPLAPCGACRQWLAELAGRLGRDLPVYSFWSSGENGLQSSALALLPHAFTKQSHQADSLSHS